MIAGTFSRPCRTSSSSAPSISSSEQGRHFYDKPNNNDKLQQTQCTDTCHAQTFSPCFLVCILHCGSYKARRFGVFTSWLGFAPRGWGDIFPILLQAPTLALDLQNLKLWKDVVLFQRPTWQEGRAADVTFLVQGEHVVLSLGVQVWRIS